MKKSEKDLLKQLSSNSYDSNEPLKDIKQSMGSLAYVKGNPLTKTEISLNVSINFFRNRQQILPAALPANLQTPLPVSLLGLTDFYSGYAKVQTMLTDLGQWITDLNYSYHEGPELIDQSFVTGWGNAVYWNVIPINFLFFGGSIQVAPGGMASIIKNNFNWIPGRQYVIRFAVNNDSPGSWIEWITDGVNISTSQPPYRLVQSNGNTVNQQTFEFYYIPTTTNLDLRAVNGGALNMAITGLSIKEVFGDISYPSDNSLGIYGYNKSWCLSNNVVKGDLVQVYNFIDRNAVNFGGFPAIDLYTAEIIVHCNNIAYGTFLNSFVSDLITINTIRYIVPIANINQFVNPLIFFYQSLFGKTNVNSVDPRMFITSKDFQQQISDIPVNLPIDKKLSLAVAVDFNCQNFNMILFVESVQSLTNNPKINLKNG